MLKIAPQKSGFLWQTSLLNLLEFSCVYPLIVIMITIIDTIIDINNTTTTNNNIKALLNYFILACENSYTYTHTRTFAHTTHTHT